MHSCFDLIIFLMKFSDDEEHQGNEHGGLSMKKLKQFCLQLWKDLREHYMQGSALFIILLVGAGELIWSVVYAGKNVLFVDREDVLKSQVLQEAFGNYLILSGCAHGMIAVLTCYCAYQQMRPEGQTEVHKHTKTDIIMLVVSVMGTVMFILLVMQAACNVWETVCTEFDRNEFFNNIAIGIPSLSRLWMNFIRLCRNLQEFSALFCSILSEVEKFILETELH